MYNIILKIYIICIFLISCSKKNISSHMCQDNTDKSNKNDNKGKSNSIELKTFIDGDNIDIKALLSVPEYNTILLHNLNGRFLNVNLDFMNKNLIFFKSTIEFYDSNLSGGNLVLLDSHLYNCHCNIYVDNLYLNTCNGFLTKIDWKQKSKKFLYIDFEKKVVKHIAGETLLRLVCETKNLFNKITPTLLPSEE